MKVHVSMLYSVQPGYRRYLPTPSVCLIRLTPAPFQRMLSIPNGASGRAPAVTLRSPLWTEGDDWAAELLRVFTGSAESG